MSRFAVILPAAGRSSRFGDPKQKKVYAEIEGRAVWLRSVEHFVNRDDVVQTIVVIAPEDRELFERRYQASVAFLNIKVVDGGAERYDSIAKALEVVDPSAEFIAIHDAARPCLTKDQVDDVFKAAVEHGAALLAVPVADTLKRVNASKFIEETVSRTNLYQAQTPQVFRRDLIFKGYANRAALGDAVTDDTQLVEAIGHPVFVVESTAMNLKITTVSDLRLATAITKAQPKPKSEGPAHPFADDNPTWDQIPKVNVRDLFS